MAKFLGTDCRRKCPQGARHDPRHGSRRGELHALRCAPRSRVRRRSTPDRAAVLHEFGIAEIREESMKGGAEVSRGDATADPLLSPPLLYFWPNLRQRADDLCALRFWGECLARRQLFQHAVVELFSPPVRRSLHKGEHQRMRFLRRGPELRLKQSCNEEPVRGRFNRAYFSLGSARRNRESRFDRAPFIIGIELKIAEEFLLNHVFAV